MAIRSYLLVGLEATLDREAVVALVRTLERLPEVGFAEPVTGPFDLWISAESDQPPEELRERVRRLPGVREVSLLKARSVPARERMWRAMTALPEKPRA
jgi:hypothetical protein